MSRRTSEPSASGGLPRDLDHVPEYRGRGRVSARPRAAPHQTWNEIALERDHVRRPRRLPLERLRGNLLRPDAGFGRLLTEVGDREIPQPRPAGGGAGHVGSGDAAEAGAANVVGMEVPALEDRDEDGELVGGVMAVDVVRRIRLGRS